MQHQPDNNIIFKNKVQALLEQTGKKIYREQDINNKYGLTVINHMMIFNNNKYFICFYDMIGNNSIPLANFNNFVKDVNNISNHKQMSGFGIIISNKSFSLPSKSQMEIENNKYQNSSFTYFYSISDLNETKLLQKIHYFLHSKQIYMYDHDGDCIMADSSVNL